MYMCTKIKMKCNIHFMLPLMTTHDQLQIYLIFFNDFIGEKYIVNNVIYIYIYIYIYVCMYICMYVCVYLFIVLVIS